MEKNFAPQAAAKSKSSEVFKKGILRIAVTIVLSIFLQSCSSEEVTPLDLRVEYKESMEGSQAIYKGIFAGKAGHRGTLQINFDNIVEGDYSADETAIATLTLSSGESFDAKLITYKSTAKSAEDFNAHFDSEDLSFDFFIDSTNTPIVSNVIFKKEEGAIVVAEHTVENPVTPVSGTYNCTNCDDKNSTINGIELNNNIRTFNLLLTSQDGQSEVTVQAALGSLISTDFVVQESCTTVGEFTFCTYKNSANLHDPVSWNGVHRYTTDSAASDSCSSLFGNLVFNSPETGTIEAEFVSDGSCSTTTYYVSTSGDDNNSGLAPQDAWKSIEKINSVNLRPGDVVLLEGGKTFNGSLILDSHDANGGSNVVRISSYGAGRATISSGLSDGFMAYNTAGIVLDNLVFSGTATTTNKNSGINFFNDLPGDVKLDFVRIENCEIYGYRDSGIVIGAWNGNSGFNDVLIENNKVHDILDAGISSYGEFSQSKVGYAHSNITVRSCEVFNIPGYGKGNNSGNGIVLSDVQHSVIEYCTAYNSGSGNTFSNGGPVGIWYWDADHVTIQHNEVYGMASASNKDGGGFDLDGGVTNGVMQYNYSHDNEGSGFLVGQFKWARPMSNIIVRYNISENDAATNGGSVFLFNGESVDMMKNIFVHNNTLVLNELRYSGAANIKYASWRPFDQNVNFFNNILVAENGPSFIDVPLGYDGKFFGNLYYTSSGFTIWYKGEKYDSLGAFRTTGNEIYEGLPVGYEGDPLLSNPGNGGTIGFGNDLSGLNSYQIQPDSPANTGGIDIPFYTGEKDFYGNSLSVDSKVIGAHEE